MREQPARPLAADVDGRAARVAGIDKKLDAFSVAEQRRQHLKRRLAQFSDVSAFDADDDHRGRGHLDHHRAMNPLEAFAVSRNHGVSHSTGSSPSIAREAATADGSAWPSTARLKRSLASSLSGPPGARSASVEAKLSNHGRQTSDT